jgi:uncharacterized protein
MPDAHDRQPNSLIHEKSPYLLQHAYNPVDWRAWGEPAFEKAAREDKLVFLSIGYATCHWCHVMERESFEDEETAKLLNSRFVPVKVDREERPDVDSIYMDALHAMGQQGGWPLSMFVTPGREPLVGGTYFPPVSRYGMKSFKEVLLAVSDAWSANKTQLLERSGELGRHLRKIQAGRPGNGLPSVACFETAYHVYDELYDTAQYGFVGDSTNKFPPSMALSYLLNHHYRTGSDKALEMVERTLGAMKKGGIYDQIGGGMCRYSTDHSWLVPHFEKMLYDNALFLKALVECFQVSGNEFFRHAAYDVISYVSRDVVCAGGGIASAEDADSEGEEGKFYLWTLQEFLEVTGKDSGFLAPLWNVTEKGNFEGKTILHEDIHSSLLAPEEMWGHARAEIIEKNRKRLLERRSERPRPLRDDKVLTSWNCLYIQGLAKAGLAFGDPELICSAESIYAFLSGNLFDSTGRLMRRYRDGEVGVLGYLSDYAEMGLACCDLFRATCNPDYFGRARSLAEDAIRLFASDFGPFYETGTDAEELIRRTINGYDGVEPSGNSSVARLLLRLSILGIETDRYPQMAEGVFRYFSSDLEQHPTACPNMLQAFATFSNPPSQIVLIGNSDNSELRQSLEFLNRAYLPDVSVVWVDREGIEPLRSSVPILSGKTPVGDFTAYVCTGMTCKAPVLSFEEMKALVNGS